MGSLRVRRVVALALLVGACSTSNWDTSVFETTDIEVGNRSFTVWVADDTDKRSQGLRGVEVLPDEIEGMLFSWAAPVSASFGMRDTLMPLDIWWFDPDGILVGSSRMEPCVDETCASYGSPGTVAWALETPAGQVDLDVGDTLSTTGAG